MEGLGPGVRTALIVRPSAVGPMYGLYAGFHHSRGDQQRRFAVEMNPEEPQVESSNATQERKKRTTLERS